MGPRRPAWPLAALTALLVSGCAAAPNARLSAIAPQSGYRYDAVAQVPAEEGDDRPFVIVTFSGGGTRAAALAYGVLDELRQTRLPLPDGGTRRLLDEVDVISSVSGGSFTAAYYGLFGDRVFGDEFRERVLYRRIQTAYFTRLLLPWNWIRLASPSFSRTDLIAELYGEEIYEGRTFDDLLRARREHTPPGPYVIVNATDMASGSRFEFSQDQFDPLCSDLGPLPVGHAVAASAAFPGAFTALGLKSYQHEEPSCGYRRPRWVEISFEHDRLENNERFALAQALDSYLRTEPEPKEFVHLLDGGVSDNLGLRGPLRALQQNRPATPWSLSDMLNLGTVRTVVVIAVNAKPAPLSRLDTTASAPGIAEVAVAAGTIPMENYTFETSDLFRREIDDIRADLEEQAESEGRAAPAIRFYYAEVRFDALADADERACYNELSTSLQLDEPEVEALVAIGPQLLCAQPEYQELRRDLGASGGCDSPPPPKPVVERSPDCFRCRFPQP